MTKNQTDALLHLLQRIVSHMDDVMDCANAIKALNDFEQSLHQKGEREMGKLSHDPRESEPVVDPGEGWEFLHIGDFIQKGNCLWMGKWIEINMPGAVVGEMGYRRYRRRVQPAPKTKEAI